MSKVDESLTKAWQGTERTMLACWPNEWREDFAEQNRLLAETNETPLAPSEYLQCRADDLEELRQKIREARRWL